MIWWRGCKERTKRTKWLATDEGDRFGRAYLRALEALTDPLECARACLRFDTRMGPYIPYGEMSTRWQMLQGRYDFQYFGSINHQLPGHQAYLQRGSKATADLLVKRAVTWPFRERLKVVWTFFPDCTEQCRAQGLRVNSKARNEKIKAFFDYFFRLDYELVERKVDTKRL